MAPPYNDNLPVLPTTQSDIEAHDERQPSKTSNSTRPPCGAVERSITGHGPYSPVTDAPPANNCGRAQDRFSDAASDPTAAESSCSLHKFTLYETVSWYYIVGSDLAETRYRVLKIDRTVDDGTLSLVEDKTAYSQAEMVQLLDTIDDGNRGTGGVKSRCTAWGLLGFIKFTGSYYMLLITKKSTVAILGGHYIYQVDGTELISLSPARMKPDARNNFEESRFLSIFGNLDLTRSFYYSYSYDITRTLQMNITRQRQALSQGTSAPVLGDLNSMFIWNNHLLRPAIDLLELPYNWCRPLIHGYIDQAAISVYGRTAYITIIARRSRLFAGARFLKRGANDQGHVANDVETEQIVSDCLTTSFHASGSRLFCNPQYTSYVQHRGSIPLYWSQDNTGVTPKPPIELNLIDPFYGAAAQHFDDLFERYGVPVYVLNLVKARERIPRESKLLDEFTNAINYLNQFLPPDRKIIYRAWDMSRAAKSHDQDVIRTLESIAESVVKATGLFHNGDGKTSAVRVQNGVARTNCIDCLDRTNAAQFVVGKRALGYQLHTLGILTETTIEYDTDAVNLFTHMYHDLGDTIAIQYGGSQLVNTMETYRKINQWTSHSRDMIESFRRYYTNSFLDGQRQEAYNLFLGNYIFTQGQPRLWDLTTDYYLHHVNPRAWAQQAKRGYVSWFTPANLKAKKLPAPISASRTRLLRPSSHCSSKSDDYWLEYYRPSALSSFPKMFAYKINSTCKYISVPSKPAQDTSYDSSPFRVRNDGENERGRDLDRGRHYHHDQSKHYGFTDYRRASKKDVMIGEPSGSCRGSGRPGMLMAIGTSLELADVPATSTAQEGLAKPDLAEDKAKGLLRSFTRAVHESLNPVVSRQEARDYVQYIAHPQNLPLVTSTEIPLDLDTEYRDYLDGSWKQDGMEGSRENLVEEDAATDAYADLLRVGDNPLAVTEEDTQKKRYKAYRKWLSGKPLFKQLPVDVEQLDVARVDDETWA